MKASRACLAWGLATLGGLAVAPARAVVSCSLSATPLMGVYAADSALTLDGSFVVSCSRAADDPQTVQLWLGLQQPATGREMLQQGGAQRLPYGLYRRRPPDPSVWTDGSGRPENDPGPGALLFTFDFLGAGSRAAQRALPFYAQVPAGLVRAVGNYLDGGVAAMLRLGAADGPGLASTVFTAGARILDSCRVTPPAAPLVLNYTGFSRHDALGSASFEVSCTEGTHYTLSVDPPGWLLDDVDISYRLSLDRHQGQGTGLAQRYTINAVAAAGQRGHCAKPGAAVCSASHGHQIVVNY